MSGRSYPIWNDVTACTYKSSKSWGAKDNCSVSVRVGSSASNSHKFVSHQTIRDTYRASLHGQVVRFRFFVCGQLMKEVLFKADKYGRAGDKVSERCAYIGTMRKKRLEGITY